MTAVEKQPHYNAHPSGVECLSIVNKLPFAVGNVIKYVWRANHKNGVEDLQKAMVYIHRGSIKEKSMAELVAASIAGDHKVVSDIIHVVSSEPQDSPLSHILKAVLISTYDTGMHYTHHILNCKKSIRKMLDGDNE